MAEQSMDDDTRVEIRPEGFKPKGYSGHNTGGMGQGRRGGQGGLEA